MYITLVVCYGDGIVAHIDINSCMFSLSLCTRSAVTDAFLRQSFFLKTMYNVLLENIFTFISSYTCTPNWSECYRCMLQCTSALKVREISYSTYTAILELAHSALTFVYAQQ